MPKSRPLESPKAKQIRTIHGASVEIFENAHLACDAAAVRIAGLIQKGPSVLGLATGATPVPVYDRLAALHRDHNISFAQVRTYNLDEYYPISPLDPQSYRFYMHKHLFSRVDLPAGQAHVLDGSVPEAFADETAAAFDRWIGAEGGLDLQLLGIGRNGHIGFNEPIDIPVDHALALPTRRVHLHPTTISDAIKDFGDELLVPRQALTVGTKSILGAKSILILAFGPNKADAVLKSLTGPVTPTVPGSLLQTVANKVTWLLDPASAADLPA